MQCMHRFYPAYAHKISWGEVIKSDIDFICICYNTQLEAPQRPPSSPQLLSSFPPSFPKLSPQPSPDSLSLPTTPRGSKIFKEDSKPPNP